MILIINMFLVVNVLITTLSEPNQTFDFPENLNKN